ncbi:MAG: L,D-transpeptidase [Bdellovibrionota bacterium]
MFFKSLLLCAFSLFTAHAAFAEEAEFNPFAPGAAETLSAFDAAYESATGLSAYPTGHGDEVSETEGCYQTNCPIFVDVDKSTQTLRLYLDGRLADQWLVSTGRPGFATPDFNKRFDGRIYQHYDSTTFPGGDYMGLGNMPYAMFISGGVALHGTPESNWRNLGRPASHGCIRVHPEHAKYLNGILRQTGVKNSWVTVHD